MPSLAFTGERLVPGQVETDIYQEHLVRYVFAEPLARGRLVLDAGCGVGYGAQRLARSAEQVMAIDNSPETIRYAGAQYSAPNLAFSVGDVTALPFSEAAFDVAVAFELIEHLHTPQLLLGELARVIKPEGVVLISTPNRRTYRDARPGYVNPFHVREYYEDEFLALLRTTFPIVRLLGQNYSQVQTFTELGTDAQANTELRLVCEASSEIAGDDAQFFLAICGFAEESVAEANRSRPVLLAGTGNVLPEKARWIQNLQQEIARRDEIIRKLQAEFEERTAWAKRSADEVVAGNETIRSLQSELDARTAWAKQSVDGIAERDTTIRDLQQELEAQSAIAKKSAEQTAALDAMIRALQKDLTERTPSEK